MSWLLTRLRGGCQRHSGHRGQPEIAAPSRSPGETRWCWLEDMLDRTGFELTHFDLDMAALNRATPVRRRPISISSTTSRPSWCRSHCETGNFGCNGGALVVAASDVDMAAQRLHPVFETDESGSTTDIGAAHSVVFHQQAQPPVVGLYSDYDL